MPARYESRRPERASEVEARSASGSCVVGTRLASAGTHALPSDPDDQEGLDGDRFGSRSAGARRADLRQQEALAVCASRSIKTFAARRLGGPRLSARATGIRRRAASPSPSRHARRRRYSASPLRRSRTNCEASCAEVAASSAASSLGHHVGDGAAEWACGRHVHPGVNTLDGGLVDAATEALASGGIASAESGVAPRSDVGGAIRCRTHFSYCGPGTPAEQEAPTGPPSTPKRSRIQRAATVRMGSMSSSPPGCG